MAANFSDILNIRKRDVVTLVGAGGKTSILKILANEIQKNILITSTTHIQALDDLTKYKIINENYRQISENIVKIRKDSNCKIFITSKIVKSLKNNSYKLKGIKKSWVNKLHHKFKDEIIIVEGDGAAQKSIKVPADYEPVVPQSCNKLITVLGMKNFKKEINNTYCHRVHEIKKLTSSATIDKELIINIIISKKSYGYYRNKVDDFIVVLNQLESCKQKIALDIGQRLVELGIKKVILADTNKNNPIIKIIN